MENKIDDTNKHDTTSDNDKNDIDTLNTPDWLSREWREKNDPPSPPPPKKIYKKKKNYNLISDERRMVKKGLCVRACRQDAGFKS